MSEKKEEVKGFYAENTVEIEVNGVKKKVNKFEAEYLEKKLKAKAKK